MQQALERHRAELIGAFECAARAYRQALQVWHGHVHFGDAHGELSSIRALSEKLKAAAEAISAIDREIALRRLPPAC